MGDCTSPKILISSLTQFHAVYFQSYAFIHKINCLCCYRLGSYLLNTEAVIYKKKGVWFVSVNFKEVVLPNLVKHTFLGYAVKLLVIFEKGTWYFVFFHINH